MELPRDSQPGIVATVGGLLAVALLLFCVLGVIGVVVIQIPEGTGAVRKTAETFLQDLERGDDASAYALLCPGTTEQFDRDQFTHAIQLLPRPHTHRITDAAFADEPGNHAVVDADLIDGAGTNHPRAIHTSRTTGGWRICGDPL